MVGVKGGCGLGWGLALALSVGGWGLEWVVVGGLGLLGRSLLRRHGHLLRQPDTKTSQQSPKTRPKISRIYSNRSSRWHINPQPHTSQQITKRIRWLCLLLLTRLGIGLGLLLLLLMACGILLGSVLSIVTSSSVLLGTILPPNPRN